MLWLRYRILLPLLAAISLGLLASLSGVYWHIQTDIQNEVENQTTIVRHLVSRRLEGYAESMRTALEAMEHNAQLRIALRNKDRDALLALSRGLFQELKSEHSIIHFYFSDPDRTIILRVHAPTHYGDTIDRGSTLKAEQSGQFSHGLELGYYGILTLIDWNHMDWTLILIVDPNPFPLP